MLDSAISLHKLNYGSNPAAKNKLIQPNLTFVSAGIIDILENELTFNHQTWKEWNVKDAPDMLKALKFANQIIATFNTYDIRYSN
jgi:hypothetical protein